MTRGRGWTAPGDTIKPLEYRPIIALLLLQDLIAELKSELSGNFSHTITSLCKSPAERDADELRKAMKVALLCTLLFFTSVL